MWWVVAYREGEGGGVKYTALQIRICGERMKCNINILINFIILNFKGDSLLIYKISFKDSFSFNYFL